MKDIIIRHAAQIAGTTISQGSNSFTVKPVADGAESDLLGVNVVEVEPGNTAYGYHYHEANEEVFYIISGTATVRTPRGEQELAAGSIIGFPRGAAGAHVVQNRGQEKLVYLDLGTRRLPDVVHFPDNGSGWACSADGTIYPFQKN
ncbi:MAG: cupin domain-containing protein [Akkermansia sp.]